MPIDACVCGRKQCANTWISYFLALNILLFFFKHYRIIGIIWLLSIKV